MRALKQIGRAPAPSRLIVEVDGGQYATDKSGAARQQWIADRGNPVLRFCNNDVLANTGGVLQSIAAAWRKPVFIASNTASARNRGDEPSARPFPRTPGEGALAPCQEKAR